MVLITHPVTYVEPDDSEFGSTDVTITTLPYYQSCPLCKPYPVSFTIGIFDNQAPEEKFVVTALNPEEAKKLYLELGNFLMG